MLVCPGLDGFVRRGAVVVVVSLLVGRRGEDMPVQPCNTLDAWP